MKAGTSAYDSRLTVEVVEFDRPRLFVDEMIQGAFHSFRHVHEFVSQGHGTLIKDTLDWTSPFGIFGRIADKLVIAGFLTRLVSERNAKLKRLAESGGM